MSIGSYFQNPSHNVTRPATTATFHRGHWKSKLQTMQQIDKRLVFVAFMSHDDYDLWTCRSDGRFGWQLMVEHAGEIVWYWERSFKNPINSFQASPMYGPYWSKIPSMARMSQKYKVGAIRNSYGKVFIDFFSTTQPCYLNYVLKLVALTNKRIFPKVKTSLDNTQKSDCEEKINEVISSKSLWLLGSSLEHLSENDAYHPINQFFSHCLKRFMSISWSNILSLILLISTFSTGFPFQNSWLPTHVNTGEEVTVIWGK